MIKHSPEALCTGYLKAEQALSAGPSSGVCLHAFHTWYKIPLQVMVQ